MKPELPADRKLASVSRDARLTFVFCITQADDHGLLAGAPRQLLGALYPHDDDVTPAMLGVWLGELEAIGVVRWRATTDGAPVLEIQNWTKHQRVDNRGRSSLAENLQPLAEPRGEPPRAAEDDGENPLGPRSMDLGEGPRSGSVARAREDELLSEILTAVPEAYRPAIEGACRASRNPWALLTELKALNSGLHGSFPWDVIGRAVHDLALAGESATALRLRVFCQNVTRASAEPALPATNGRRRYVDPIQQAIDELKAEEAAKRGAAGA